MRVMARSKVPVMALMMETLMDSVSGSPMEQRSEVATAIRMERQSETQWVRELKMAKDCVMESLLDFVWDP